MVAKGKFRSWRKESLALPSATDSRKQSDMEQSPHQDTLNSFKRQLADINKPIPSLKLDKFVTFSDEPSVHEVLGRKDYTEAEKAAAYWSIPQLKGMREDVKELVKILEMGLLDFVDDSELQVVRRYSRKETKARKRLRKQTAQSIISHQKSFGSLQETWLNKVYQPSTDVAQQAAYVRAVPPEKQHLVNPPMPQIIVR